MKLFLTISILFITIGAWAQKGDTVRTYLDDNLHLTTRDKAVYPAVAIRNQDHWVLYSTYRDTSMLLKVWFKDKQLSIYDGPYTLYFGKGIKAVEGYYKDSRRIGIWKYYYPDGAIKDSGEINGKWKSWYPNGILESEGEYADDLMAGTWTWYRENGKPSSIEEYKKGKVVKMQCFDEQGNYSGEFCSILKPPYPLGEFRDFQSHMLDNISMPKDLQKKELKGMVLITCDITKEGKLSKVVVQSPYEQLTKEVERFFNTLTTWSPAITHNRVIDYTIEYKIPLQNF